MKTISSNFITFIIFFLRRIIFNTSTYYCNSYSNLSFFNDGASNPPKIIGSSGMVGYLSIGPSWQSDRFSPYDIKYTCDWD